ncbi:MAG: ABC transporter permease, partial [Gemmatimonadetes bacterium]|nr:ABC transporter permease [Gemmatimonadota bacterium]
MKPWPRRLLEWCLPHDDWSREFLASLDEALAAERFSTDGGGLERAAGWRDTLWWWRRLIDPATAEFVIRMRRRRRKAVRGREYSRGGRGGAAMAGWVHDIRLAFRSLLREGRTTGFILFTLALGIGANAALYGVAERLFLRGPVGVDRPESLVRVFLEFEGSRDSPDRRSPWIPWATSSAIADAFAGATRYRFEERIAVASESVGPLRVSPVDAHFAEVLGVRPAVGRWFLDDDGPDVIVVSDGLARRAFSTPTSALGAQLHLDGHPYTVIGVTPEGFSGVHLERVDVWMPLDLDAAGFRNWLVAGRLPDVESRDRVRAEADAAHRRTDPGASFQWAVDGAVVLTAIDAGDDGLRPPEVAVAALLLGVSLLVLFVGLANVVNLLLARLARRRREIAVRLALGIGRGRLARFLMTENLLLAVGAGLISLPIAWVAGSALRGVLLPDVAWAASPLPLRVIAATGLVALASGVLVSLVPLVRAGRWDVGSGLRAGARGATSGGGRTQWALVMSQVAFSTALLVAAGLFLQSFRAMRITDLGVDADRVAALVLREARPGAIPSPSREEWALYQRALDRVQEIPEVGAAAITLGLPFLYNFGLSVAVPGRDSIPELPGGGPWMSAVTSDYFEATGTALLEGRGFTDSEVDSDAPVVVVSRAMADQLWRGRSAIGECLHVGTVESRCSRVVGVVEDVHRTGYREPPSMQYYLPLQPGGGFGGMALVVDLGPRRQDSLESLREQVSGLDPSVGYVEAIVLESVLAPQVQPWRMGAWVLGMAAAIALLVSVVGVYGVLSYRVERRRREMGVRIALGASVAGIRGLVLRQGLGSTAAGLLVGLAATLAAARWLEPLLFETRVGDPRVIGSVVLVLLGTATAA